jgi:hypothetical protein
VDNIFVNGFKSVNKYFKNIILIQINHLSILTIIEENDVRILDLKSFQLVKRLR